VDDQELYQLLDTDGVTDDIHLFNEKLREWEDYYNYHRPHGAPGGQSPYERLVEKTRAGVSARSSGFESRLPAVASERRRAVLKRSMCRAPECS
jgi:hypothetical protein